MVYLFKVLSDIAPKPSATFSFPHMPKTQSQTQLHDLIYPAPPSSLDIPIVGNPNQFGLTEMGLQTLCFPS